MATSTIRAVMHVQWVQSWHQLLNLIFEDIFGVDAGKWSKIPIRSVDPCFGFFSENAYNQLFLTVICKNVKAFFCFGRSKMSEINPCAKMSENSDDVGLSK